MAAKFQQVQRLSSFETLKMLRKSNSTADRSQLPQCREDLVLSEIATMSLFPHIRTWFL